MKGKERGGGREDIPSMIHPSSTAQHSIIIKLFHSVAGWECVQSFDVIFFFFLSKQPSSVTAKGGSIWQTFALIAS